MKKLLILLPVIILIFCSSCLSSLMTLKDVETQREAYEVINKEYLIETTIASIQAYEGYCFEYNHIKGFSKYEDGHYKLENGSYIRGTVKGAEKPYIKGYKEPVPVYYELKFSPGWRQRQALIFQSEDEKKIIVAFKGSEIKEDWWNNLQFGHTAEYSKIFPEIEKEIHVSKGFYTIYEGIKKELNQTLDKMIEDKTEEPLLLITGHSLGGALANIFALDYAYNHQSRRDLIHVYTYAAPRSGDIRFQETYDYYVENSLRVINQADPAPEVPLKKMPFSKRSETGHYVHVGKQYSIFFYPDHTLTLRSPSSLNAIINFTGITRIDTNAVGIYLSSSKIHKKCHSMKNYGKTLIRVLNLELDTETLENNGLTNDTNDKKDTIIIVSPFLEYR